MLGVDPDSFQIYDLRSIGHDFGFEQQGPALYPDQGFALIDAPRAALAESFPVLLERIDAAFDKGRLRMHRNYQIQGLRAGKSQALDGLSRFGLPALFKQQ